MVAVLVLLRRSTRRRTPADEDLRHRRRQNLEFRKDVSVEHATVRNSTLQLSKESQPTYPTHIPLTTDSSFCRSHSPASDYAYRNNIC